MNSVNSKYSAGNGRDSDSPGGEAPVRDTDAFQLLLMGHFDSSAVSVQFRNRMLEMAPRLQPLVDAQWQQQLAVARNDGRTLFDGEMLRLDGYHRCTGLNGRDCLELQMSRTKYSQFVGTNLAADRQSFLDDSTQWSNPLGLSALIVCDDEKILLGLRGKGTFLYSGYWHTFGGMADLRDVDERGNVSLFNVIRRELTEELGITKSDVTRMHSMGLVRDRAILQPEMIFEVHVAKPSADIISRATSPCITSSDPCLESTDSNNEHDRFCAIDDNAPSVDAFVKSHPTKITPVALATLTRHFHPIAGG